MGGSAAQRHKPARSMSDMELVETMGWLGGVIDEWEAADDDDVGHGGSPGEWMFERWSELETEAKKRGYCPTKADAQ